MINLRHHWHNTKRIIGDAWHHSVKLAGQFDQGIQVGKRLLAATAPIFDQLGGSYKPIMDGLTAYDKGKSDVVGGYNNVQSHYNRIRRQVPELELG